MIQGVPFPAAALRALHIPALTKCTCAIKSLLLSQQLKTTENERKEKVQRTKRWKHFQHIFNIRTLFGHFTVLLLGIIVRAVFRAKKVFRGTLKHKHIVWPPTQTCLDTENKHSSGIQRKNFNLTCSINHWHSFQWGQCFSH